MTSPSNHAHRKWIEQSNASLILSLCHHQIPHQFRTSRIPRQGGPLTRAQGRQGSTCCGMFVCDDCHSLLKNQCFMWSLVVTSTCDPPTHPALQYLLPFTLPEPALSKSNEPTDHTNPLSLLQHPPADRHLLTLIPASRLDSKGHRGQLQMLMESCCCKSCLVRGIGSQAQERMYVHEFALTS